MIWVELPVSTGTGKSGADGALADASDADAELPVSLPEVLARAAGEAPALGDPEGDTEEEVLGDPEGDADAETEGFPETAPVPVPACAAVSWSDTLSAAEELETEDPPCPQAAVSPRSTAVATAANGRGMACTVQLP